MAFIKLLCAVARNRKFVKAGPAPSWLWVCGLMYCQEGETDGFIPAEALPYLGVKNAVQLADHLVKAGLWDVAEGGWTVHDYLEHNRSAEEIAELKGKRADGGKRGGRPKRNLPVNLPQTLKVSGQETFPVAVSVAVSESASEGVQGESLDVAFASFQSAYPAQRRKGGYPVQTAFIDQALKAGSAAALMEALSNHIASEQWADPKLVPGMDVWLREERWRQRLDPKSARPQGKSSDLPAWVQRAKAVNL